MIGHSAYSDNDKLAASARGVVSDIGVGHSNSLECKTAAKLFLEPDASRSRRAGSPAKLGVVTQAFGAYYLTHRIYFENMANI